MNVKKIAWFWMGSQRNWYVRPSGGSYGTEDGTSYANAWDGFSNIVWASIRPGDILYVAGTHSEKLTIGASGISTNYIYVKSLIADPATITGSLSRNMCVDATNRTYIEFDGLTLTNSTDSNLYLSNGTYVVRNVVASGATAVGAQGFQNETGTIATYYNCESHHNTDDGLSLHVNANVTCYDCNFHDNAQGINGISTSVCTIYRCTFSANSTADFQPDSNATFTAYNCFFQSTTGVSANSTVDTKVYTSVFNNSLGGAAVLGTLTLEECVFFGTGGVTSNKTVVMNRCYVKSSKSNVIQTSGAGSVTMNYCVCYQQANANIMRHVSTGTFVANNCTIVAINNTTATAISCTVPGFTANNCIFNTMQNAVSSIGATAVVTLNKCNIFNVSVPTFTSGGGTITNNNPVAGNPLLTAPASDNFALQAGSVAIDAGNNTGIATGISSATWGSTAPVYPVVVTATQSATYDLGAYIYN